MVGQMIGSGLLRHLAQRGYERRVVILNDTVATLLAGKSCDAHEAECGIAVEWRPRGEDTRQRIVATRVISCIGPQGDVARTDDPLLSALVGASTTATASCAIGTLIWGTA